LYFGEKEESDGVLEALSFHSSSTVYNPLEDPMLNGASSPSKVPELWLQ
jgi:hypothetical protein